MYDHIRLRNSHILLPGEYIENPVPFEQFGLVFHPNCPKGLLKCYTSDFNGLHLSYFPYGLYVENSIQKFSNGNNYGNFLFSELLESIDKICDRFESAPTDFKVNRQEFGINISMSDPMGLIKRAKICKLKEAEPMKNPQNGKMYGVRFVFSQFELKIYYKTIQTAIKEKVHLNDDILRVEIVFKKQIALGSAIKTLEDFKQKGNLFLCFEKMISLLDQIKLSPSVKSIRRLNEADLQFCYAGLSSDFWEIMRKRNRNRFNYKRKLYRNLEEKCFGNDDTIAVLIIALYKKFMYSILH